MSGRIASAFLPLLQGEDKPVRECAVNQSIHGWLAIRKGPWKLILGKGSGGWSKGGDSLPGQLYNLDDDLGETKNRYADKPAIVAELTGLMEKFVEDGRTTPGPRQANDVPVHIVRPARQGRGK